MLGFWSFNQKAILEWAAQQGPREKQEASALLEVDTGLAQDEDEAVEMVAVAVLAGLWYICCCQWSYYRSRYWICGLQLSEVWLEEWGHLVVGRAGWVLDEDVDAGREADVGEEMW